MCGKSDLDRVFISVNAERTETLRFEWDMYLGYRPLLVATNH